MRNLRAPVVVLALLSLIGAPSPLAARPQDAKVAAATAEAARIGRRDPAGEAVARMRIAETLMLTDPPAAATMVEAARAASVRAEGPDGPMVALADYRLALIRALGGDRATQLPAMAAAAQRLAGRARTPEHRTLAGQALIVAASFVMNTGEAKLTAALRDAAVAMLSGPGLAQTTDLAESYRVLGDVLVFQNRPAEALVWANRSVALYDRVAPADGGMVYALARRGSAYLRLSRFAEAQETLRRAAALADRGTFDDPTVPILALRALGFYYARVGEHDLALPLFTRALVQAEKLPPGFPYAGGLSRDIMTTLLDADRPEEARHYAEETARVTRATIGAASYEYASAVLVIARIDIAGGAYDAAARRIDEADAVFTTSLVAGNGRRFEPLAARAALFAATGRAAEAAALYDRARALIADMPVDDTDRIDLAEGSAAARLRADPASPAGWTAARAAADGLTVRVVRQVSGVGAIDTARGRSERVFDTALDSAWARGRAVAARQTGRTSRFRRRRRLV